MFAGRQKELVKLESMYKEESFQFAVIYGRRRVGKTTLISEFLKDKRAIAYISVEGTMKENLTGLSAAVVHGLTGDTGFSGMVYQDFEALLTEIDGHCKEQRLVLAIDEYPYLAASYPAISSLLQRHIDMCWKNSRLFLILCGSSLSFMENQVLGYKSPLYGRRTAQFKIRPFTFFESRELLGTFSPEEQAVLYGVTGGVPEYLNRVQPTLSLDDNLLTMFFDNNGMLFEEPVNLLKQEMREPASYHSIVSAIASGASKLNEIATKTGLESSACSNFLTSLIQIGIVEKEKPVTEKENSRKTLYRLSDSMFLFWYRFVRPNITAISMGIGKAVYEKNVKPQINDFMGSVFEEICRQYLCRTDVYPTLPFLFGRIGKWWETNRKERREEEIDIVAVDDKRMILGECKWRNEKTDGKVLYTLVERGELLSGPEKYYYVFSKSGFEENTEEPAARYGVRRITFQEML
jgi:AAA+ ATPase superfamily predicted ATPase